MEDGSKGTTEPSGAATIKLESDIFVEYGSIKIEDDVPIIQDCEFGESDRRNGLSDELTIQIGEIFSFKTEEDIKIDGESSRDVTAEDVTSGNNNSHEGNVNFQRAEFLSLKTVGNITYDYEYLRKEKTEDSDEDTINERENENKTLDEHGIGPSRKYTHKADPKLQSDDLTQFEYLYHTPSSTFETANVRRERFMCKPCDYGTNLKKQLKTRRGEKRFACNSSDYRSAAAGGMKLHKRIHTEKNPFTCNDCGYRSTSRSHLKRHITRIHSNGTDGQVKPNLPYVCNECDYRCSASIKMTNHIMTHTGEKPFTCDQCGHKFNRESNLKRHMRVHAGEKPFKCDHCGYKCGSISDLQRHGRVHTGEKPFPCNDCNHRFTQASSLKTHMMRKHTKERPFACRFCEYSCVTQAVMRLHMMNHTGKKPYACNDCEYRSTSARTLQIHKRIHTREKPYV